MSPRSGLVLEMACLCRYAILAILLLPWGPYCGGLSLSSRRKLLRELFSVTTGSSGASLLSTSAPPPAFAIESSLSSSAAASPNVDGIVTTTIQAKGDRLGLGLEEATSSTDDPMVVVRESSSPKLLPGMVLQDYPTLQSLRSRLENGPYPVELSFRSNMSTTLDAASSPSSPNAATTYRMDKVKSAPCTQPSRRGNVLEMQYDAYYVATDGRNRILYDASAQRGTGQPYQMVLGSGDMIPGVDQGLYDMCPGDVRTLSIPSVVAYGARGNRLFQIPPNANLVWEVELVRINN